VISEQVQASTNTHRTPKGRHLFTTSLYYISLLHLFTTGKHKHASHTKGGTLESLLQGLCLFVCGPFFFFFLFTGGTLESLLQGLCLFVCGPFFLSFFFLQGALSRAFCKVCVFLWVCGRVCVFSHPAPPLCVCVCLCACLCVCLSVCLPACLCVCVEESE